MQFRLYPIAITADIEKAYIQINIEEEHRDYLRFLWFTNLFNDEKVKVCKYRFTRVIFGATCSERLLNTTAYKHIQKYANIDIDFVKRVQGKFYDDGLSTRINTVNEGIDVYKKLRIRFGEAQFNLRKFRTNNKKLGQSFEENGKDTNGGKVLGIEWDEFTDKLIFRLSDIFKNSLNVKPTKRNILAIISSIYDPVGYMQPITIQLKILFQEICKVKVEWDDVIDFIVPKWEGICNRLKGFDKIMIERCYFIYHIHDPIENCYLHGFSDSSLSAYAACIYLKSLSRSGNVFVRFVTAKSRVVPLKKALTVPRLELLGAYILSNLILCMKV